MILKNQPVENLQRSGMDTQNFLEQMLFNSFPDLKINDIVPYCGLLDFDQYVPGGDLYLGKNFWVVNKLDKVATPNLIIRNVSGTIVLYDKPIVSNTLDEYIDEVIAAIYEVYGILGLKVQCSRGFPTREILVDCYWVASDADHVDPSFIQRAGLTFVDMEVVGVVEGVFQPHDSCAQRLNVAIYEDVNNRALYYGRFLVYGNQELLNLQLFDDLVLYDLLHQKPDWPVLFSAVLDEGETPVKIYFIGYKITFDNVPAPPEVQAPVIVTPFGGTVAPLILFYSSTNRNSEGQPVIGYKTTFANGTTKIGFINPFIALDYEDIDASAMLLLSEALQGQLKVVAKDNTGKIGEQILKDITGDINPLSVKITSTAGQFMVTLKEKCDFKITMYFGDMSLMTAQALVSGLNAGESKLFNLTGDYTGKGAWVGLKPIVNGFECPFEFYREVYVTL